MIRIGISFVSLGVVLAVLIMSDAKAQTRPLEKPYLGAIDIRIYSHNIRQCIVFEDLERDLIIPMLLDKGYSITPDLRSERDTMLEIRTFTHENSGACTIFREFRLMKWVAHEGFFRRLLLEDSLRIHQGDIEFLNRELMADILNFIEGMP